MTTITMEKHILKRLDALEDFAKEIRAALAAPATTPEQPRPFIPWSKEAEMLESWAAQPERKPPQGDAMTTREAFEAVFTSAKAYTNETTGDYLQPYLQAWHVWQAATNAALERAAVACESLGMTTSGIYERNHECASAIRALKEIKE